MDTNERIAAVLPDHKSALLGMARALVPHANEDHDDLAQEGYIAMWRALDEHDPTKGSLNGFLRAVARQRMIVVLSDPRRLTGAPKVPMTQHGKRRGDETRQRIREFIRDYQRDHGERPSQAKIGAALGMNPGNVHRHLQRMHMHYEPPTHRATTRPVTSLDELLDGSTTDSGSDLDIDRVLLADAVIEDLTLAYHYGEIHEAIADLDESWREYVYLRFWCGMTNAEVAASRGVQPSTAHHAWSQSIRPRLVERLSHLIDA